MGFDIRKKIAGREYLLRLILLFFALIVLPLLAIQYAISRRAGGELERQGIQRYHESAVSFGNYYGELLGEINDITLQIRVERKLLPNVIFSHPWYRIEAVETLRNYARMLPSVSRIGLYFKDTDTILTSEHTYTVKQFLATLRDGDQGMSGEFARVLAPPYDWEWTALSSFGDSPGPGGRLILAKPLITGYGLEREAIVFYELSGGSLSSRFTGLMNQEKIGLAVFDGTRLIYANGIFERSLARDRGFTSFLRDHGQPAAVFEADGLGLSAFRSYHEGTGASYLVTVPEDMVRKKGAEFRASMQTIFLVLAFGVILACILAVYASYRPISSVVRRIRQAGKSAGGEGEIETIEHAIRDIRKENQMISEVVSEQRLMLMDYVLGNILCGIPAAKGSRIVQDEALTGRRLLCLVAGDLSLRNGEREKLVQAILDRTGVKALMTDLPYEKHTVVICALGEGASPADVTAGIRGLLESAFRKDPVLGIGSVVSGLEELRKSYLHALLDLESRRQCGGKARSDECRAKTPYSDESLAQFLQCVQVGYLEDAMASLKTLFSRLHGHADPVERNFLCYELLVSYIHTVRNMHVPLDHQAVSDLTCFDHPSSLLLKLSRHVEEVCGTVRERRDSANGQIKKSLVTYVNDHYADPDTTLTKVSDELGISIYTCSRFFKEYTGIGFKEYILSKRMDLAKQLLSTTDRKIGEIAVDVGFGASSHFVNCFKANYGLSPARYRDCAVADR